VNETEKARSKPISLLLPYESMVFFCKINCTDKKHRKTIEK
jgi:hypothetical protein